MHCFVCLHWNLSGGHGSVEQVTGLSSVPSKQFWMALQSVELRKQRFTSHWNPLSPVDRFKRQAKLVDGGGRITLTQLTIAEKIGAIRFGVAWSIVNVHLVTPIYAVNVAVTDQLPVDTFAIGNAPKLIYHKTNNAQISKRKNRVQIIDEKKNLCHIRRSPDRLLPAHIWCHRCSSQTHRRSRIRNHSAWAVSAPSSSFDRIDPIQLGWPHRI